MSSLTYSYDDNAGDSETDITTYESIRRKNIELRESLFKQLVEELKADGITSNDVNGDKEFTRKRKKPWTLKAPSDRPYRKPRSRGQVVPTRRSERIKQSTKKVKRVKGFIGFQEQFRGFNNLIVSCVQMRIVEQGVTDGKYFCNCGIDDSIICSDPLSCNDEKHTCIVVSREDLYHDGFSNDSDYEIEKDDDGDFNDYDEIVFCENTDVSSSEDESSPPRKKRASVSKHSLPVPVLDPDEVTEDDIANIAQSSTAKVYSRSLGTSCHQCRQKTIDTKTVCRSGHCVGVRGQFCGPCLQNRYGENAAEALKDLNWECPPCRNVCNCSVCRTRNGQLPTGILAPIVRLEGYNSVMEYLQTTEESITDIEKKKQFKSIVSKYMQY